MATQAPDNLAPQTFAAVDLGSNSFHLVVARAQPGGPVEVVDRLKESVRLAAGLDREHRLSTDAQARALDCLARFGQRLQNLVASNVRAVGTDTLRRVREADDFLAAAEQALGCPIEVIYGVEEARLIYAGVTLDLDDDQPRRLVIDIGGGSTEIAAGRLAEPNLLESLSLGAISHSRQHLSADRIDGKSWKAAVTAARLQLAPVERAYRAQGWDIALGASGSIKAIHGVCAELGWCRETLTPTALQRLAKRLIKAGKVDANKLPTLSADRQPIFAGSLAVLTAVFEALEIEALHVSDKALREGILIGLQDQRATYDMRSATVAALQNRYAIDAGHSERIAATVERLSVDAGEWLSVDAHVDRRLLHWAARLHEVGLAISHKGYHKHGAYIIHHADLHGFSRSEQAVIAALLRLHRGKFNRSALADLPLQQRIAVTRMAVLLRLAVLLHRGRDPTLTPAPTLTVDDDKLRLGFPPGWLDDRPLTCADLEREREVLASTGFMFSFGD